MKTLIVIFAVFVAAVNSEEVVQDEGKPTIVDIRNQCIAETQVTPKEIGILLTAARSVEKFINTTKCVVTKIKEAGLESEAHAANLPTSLNDIIAKCQLIFGQGVCAKIERVVNIIIEKSQNRPVPPQPQPENL